MACCGKKRTQFATPPRSSSAPVPRAEGVPPARAFLEYTGSTALSTRGPVSGRHYRFERPGARLEIDPRDRRSLLAVPHLREVL